MLCSYSGLHFRLNIYGFRDSASKLAASTSCGCSFTETTQPGTRWSREVAGTLRERHTCRTQFLQIRNTQYAIRKFSNGSAICCEMKMDK